MLTFPSGWSINQHLDTWESQYPELLKEIREGLYVDDLMSGGESAEITAEKKIIAAEVLKDALFMIHNWQTNVPDLEAIGSPLCERRVNMR